MLLVSVHVTLGLVNCEILEDVGMDVLIDYFSPQIRCYC